jgi:hypothetical protein
MLACPVTQRPAFPQAGRLTRPRRLLDRNQSGASCRDSPFGISIITEISIDIVRYFDNH